MTIYFDIFAFQCPWISILIVLSVISSFVSLFWYVGVTADERLFKKLPGPWTIPIIGNLHQTPLNQVKLYEKMCTAIYNFPNEPFFAAYLGCIRMVFCHRPESMELILNSSQHIKKADDYRFLWPWLGSGLLTSTGNKWRKRRKLLTPSFHYSILRNYMDIFNKHAITLMDILQSKSDGDLKFDIFPKISLSTLDIICEAAMGKDIQAQIYCDSEYVKAVLRINEIIFKRIRSPWLWPDPIFNMLPIGKEHNKCLSILHTFTNQVIKERNELLLKEGFFDFVNEDISSGNNSFRKLSFLDLLLKSRSDQTLSSVDDVREEVDTFMFEGHDTTAGSLAWTVQLLGCHFDIQEKLFSEIAQVCSPGYTSYDDLNKLEYLNCVIKESLRLYPSVPWFGRKIEEPIDIEGYTIPKNTTLIIMVHQFHQNGKYYSNPDEFIPERFLAENTDQRPAFSYIPFSAGQRNCIGQKFAMMEMKVVLSHLVQNYRIQSVSSCADVKPSPDIILRPSNGVWVTLTSR